MMGVKAQDSDYDDFVEVDPTGRYGRYNEILGKGASKTVYRGFDEYEGIEVAWNQVKLNDFLRSPEDMERLYCEIHLLKTLKHKNIMKFYTSWVDISNRNINFVTELFTSGTLRQYRQKHKRVHMRAVKHWCRQILRGLLYLHCHDPPIIHRDLKCDNIFINGNRGVVKIGDLGLAAILRKSHAAHCVGTPEFMAPEVYEEDYNELVDIYSFGMCVLEMVTFEYPYSECTHPAQIYKKVISGSKPEALSRVEDAEVRRFVEKCLATASQRLSARELLEDPFLRIDELGSGSWEGDISKMCQILRQPSYGLLHMNGSLIANGFAEDLKHESRAENGWHDDAPQRRHMAMQSSHRLDHCRGSLITNWLDDDQLHEIKTENGWDYNTSDFETDGIDLFNGHEDEHLANVDITINGRMREDGGIFLRLRITDNEGRVRNIYFPFDIESDTAFGVATEMVGELDITDHDVTRIAEMINGEVSSLVHELKPGPGPEEMPGFSTSAFCHNCASNVSSRGSLLLKSAHCSGLDCAAMHGRFEEITYHVEGSEQRVDEEATELSTGHSQVLDLSSKASTDEEGGQFDRSSIIEKQTIEALESNISDDYGNSIHQELRWLKSKHRMELSDHGNQELEEMRDLNSSREFDNTESTVANRVTGFSAGIPLQASSEKQMKPLKKISFGIAPRRNLLQTGYYYSRRPNSEARSPRHCEPNSDGGSRNMVTAKSFYAGSICKTKSLPVDAVGSYMY